MAAQKLLKINDIIKTDICPVSKHYLMRMIKNGEDHKAGRLREGVNYILATNIGFGKKRARWAVSMEELEAWQTRAKKHTF